MNRIKFHHTRPARLLTVVFLLLLYTTTMICAQETAESGEQEKKKKELSSIQKFLRKKRVNSAYIMIGIDQNDLENVNRALEKASFPDVSGITLPWGWVVIS